MRESKLMSRRRNAEELLKWKKKLDEEEKKVYNLEKKALKVWDKKDGQQKEKEPSAISTAISVASAASLTATKDDSETNKKDVATNGTTKGILSNPTNILGYNLESVFPFVCLSVCLCLSVDMSMV